MFRPRVGLPLRTAVMVASRAVLPRAPLVPGVEIRRVASTSALLRKPSTLKGVAVVRLDPVIFPRSVAPSGTEVKRRAVARSGETTTASGPRGYRPTMASYSTLAVRMPLVWEPPRRIEVVAPLLNSDEKSVRLMNVNEIDQELRNLLAQHPVTIRKVLKRAIQLLCIFLPVCALGAIAYFFPRFQPSWWRLLTRSLETAGPCFIKLGQWASTRADLFPPSACMYLSEMRGDVHAHSFRFTEAYIRDAFGKDIDEVFSHFGREPIASGSVAQVYRANLWGGGTVAVKVRHPHVEPLFTADLTLVAVTFNLVAKVTPNFRYMNIHAGLLSFAQSLFNQLDFSEEARHLERFQRNFKEREGIVFPTPVRPYVHAKVLVETFERGVPVMSYVKTHPSQSGIIGRRIVETFLNMMLDDNFIHGDLHPGNIFVRPAPNSPGFVDLVLLDAGMTHELPPEDRMNVLHLMEAFALKDGEQGALVMLDKDSNCSDREGFIREQSKQLEKLHLPFSQLSLGQTLMECLAITRKYHVMLEGNLSSLLAALFLIEGIGRQLDPSINFLDMALPHFIKAELKRRTWGELFRHFLPRLFKSKNDAPSK